MNDEKIISQPAENKGPLPGPDDLARLLQANLDRSEEILKTVVDMKKYIRWQQIWSVFRLLLIFVPLIIAFIYLPPIFKDVLNTYQSFLK